MSVYQQVWRAVESNKVGLGWEDVLKMNKPRAQNSVCWSGADTKLCMMGSWRAYAWGGLEIAGEAVGAGHGGTGKSGRHRHDTRSSPCTSKKLAWSCLLMHTHRPADISGPVSWEAEKQWGSRSNMHPVPSSWLLTLFSSQGSRADSRTRAESLQGEPGA